MYRHTACAVVALMTVGVPTAFAQDNSETVGLGTILLDQNTSEAGERRIDREEIEDRAPNDSGDLFAGESAITTSSPNAGAQRIFVNGIEETQLNVQVDGARLPNGPFHHASSSLIDTSILKQVTVKPGVAAADDGPRAVAGAIQFETMDARDLLTEDKHIGGKLSLGYRDNGETFSRGLLLYGQEGGFEFLLNAREDSGENYSDGSGTEMPGTAAGLTNYLAKFAYTAETGDRFEFSANQSEESALRPFRAEWLGIAGRDISLEPQDYARETYTFSYVDEKPEGWFAPEVHVSYSEITLDHAGISGRTKSSSFNAKVQNVFELRNGTVTAGVDFFRDFGERSRFEEDGTETVGSPFDETSDNIGIFAQARQDITPSLRLSYGARADFQKIKNHTGSDTTTEGLSGNLSVEYDLSDSLTLDAGISSVFGGIPSSEALILSDADDVNYAAVKSLRSENARIGLHYNQGPWSAGASAFYTKIKDASSIRSVAERRADRFDFETRGIDLDIGYRTDRTRFSLNYTYSDVTRDGEADHFNHYYGTPTGSIIGLSFAHDINQSWTVGGNAAIALKNTDTVGIDDDERNVAQPAYEVLNLYATYAPVQADGLEVRFGIDNVFDETYASRSNYGTGRGTIVQHNEIGRSFSISTNWTF